MAISRARQFLKMRKLFKSRTNLFLVIFEHLNLLFLRIYHKLQIIDFLFQNRCLFLHAHSLIPLFFDSIVNYFGLLYLLQN